MTEPMYEDYSDSLLFKHSDCDEITGFIFLCDKHKVFEF